VAKKSLFVFTYSSPYVQKLHLKIITKTGKKMLETGILGFNLKSLSWD